MTEEEWNPGPANVSNKTFTEDMLYFQFLALNLI